MSSDYHLLFIVFITYQTHTLALVYSFVVRRRDTHVVFIFILLVRCTSVLRATLASLYYYYGHVYFVTDFYIVSICIILCLPFSNDCVVSFTYHSQPPEIAAYRAIRSYRIESRATRVQQHVPDPLVIYVHISQCWLRSWSVPVPRRKLGGCWLPGMSSWNAYQEGRPLPALVRTGPRSHFMCRLFNINVSRLVVTHAVNELLHRIGVTGRPSLPQYFNSISCFPCVYKAIHQIGRTRHFEKYELFFKFSFLTIKKQAALLNATFTLFFVTLIFGGETTIYFWPWRITLLCINYYIPPLCCLPFVRHRGLVVVVVGYRVVHVFGCDSALW